MSNIQITCDSTCDLSAEILQKYGIVSLPLYVRIGDEEYLDGVSINSDTLFQKIRETGTLPKTSAISVGGYEDFWKPYLDAGKEIVHIDISSQFSSCFQNATIAAQESGRVYPVDSLNLSTGSGLLAIEAAIMAENGKSAAEIVEALNEKRYKVNASFVIDTMEYLAKGGRCSSVAAFAAGLIKLRLCIGVADGKMDVAKKYRGKMSAVLCEYVRDRLSATKDAELDRIFITDSGVDEETFEKVKQTVLECRPFAEVLHTRAGCTISSHCGPGTLGILFFEK